jgi:plastocyanin
MKRQLGLPLLLIALSLLGSVVLLLGHPARGMAGASVTPAGSTMEMGGMSDADMAATAKRYWSTHQRVGPTAARSAFTQSVVDTVTASGFTFNADNNLATGIDTVRLHTGDTVFWKWVNGSHTVTNGTGPTDSTAATIFDMPLDAFDTSYQFSSATPETIPYFCSFHVTFGMKGVLIFTDPLVGVGGGTGTATLGFASRPSPNPTRGTVSFRYALKEAGHVHAAVLDVRGRRVAVVLDAERAAGTYEASWDGRREGGALAPAGRYFVHLTVPGAVQSRGITLMR